jgi:hypothetical protein
LGKGAASTAGDVNGDGYSDVIVGAPGYDDTHTGEGRVYVFHGGSSGLAGSPTWVCDGEQDNALFGDGASTAGDVNGDGYADIIVSASRFDNGQTDEGRVFVYHGSSTGIGSSEPWWTAESNQVGAMLGEVAAAGDVNGDGYGDVVVGAYYYDNGQSNEGRSYVYLGTPVGLSSSADWAAESNQASAMMGSVAGGGDVNGDGYSDVLVGASNYDNGHTNEGRVFVYYGNGGGPLGAPVGSRISAAPRQRTTTDTKDIAPLGKSNNATSFRINAKLPKAGPVGRTKMKLQWEVKPHGAPFDGLSLGTSTSWFDPWPGNSLAFNVDGLTSGAKYHWRVRIRFLSGGWSPWYTFSRTGGLTPDLRMP